MLWDLKSDWLPENSEESVQLRGLSVSFYISDKLRLLKDKRTASAHSHVFPSSSQAVFSGFVIKGQKQHQICVEQEFEFLLAEAPSLTSGLVVCDPEWESAAKPMFTQYDQRFRLSRLKHAGKVRDPFDLLWLCKRMTCWWCSWSAIRPSEAHPSSLAWCPNDIKAFSAPFHSGTSATKISECHRIKEEEPHWEKSTNHNKY